MEGILKNNVYTVEIKGMTHEGIGVGKIDRFPIFIEDALEGEKVEVKIIKVLKNYAVGKLLRIIEESEVRETPFCEVFKKCGGCSIQHSGYKGQLDFKWNLVKDNLERIGGLKNIKINKILGMEKPFNYRNKAQYPVSKGDNGVGVGFYSKRSHDIVPHNYCGIQEEGSNKIVQLIKEFIVKNNISVYDEKTGKGLIRHIMTRNGFKTGEIMVVIVATSKVFSERSAIVSLLLENFPEIKSIILNVNSKKTNVILGDTNIVLYGSEKIVDYIGKYKFEISPHSFFQVNPIQTEILYGKALEYADLKGNETVFDLYCGIGTISLFLSQKAKKVYGVEIVAAAIEDARRNAVLNGVENVEFIEGEAEAVIPRMYEAGIKADVVVVDPPRKGCDEALLETLVRMEPKRIVYVSCNPATLARDLKYLYGQGFSVVEVQPVDMFPHTVHVEAIVLLQRL